MNSCFGHKVLEQCVWFGMWLNIDYGLNKHLANMTKAVPSVKSFLFLVWGRCGLLCIYCVQIYKINLQIYKDTDLKCSVCVQWLLIAAYNQHYNNFSVPNLIHLADCEDSTYGASCQSQCHCADDVSCQADTGVCYGRQCHPEWYGINCQGNYELRL